ncbi:hypothetical protein [Nocardia altamirensis]|uniref:hypothetical protein n=1 Tax=Nocardia altamirensis TaxID=472158 RepID=UPI000840415F|nr:hypothetical protein [Nocardia altamirensis]
MLAVVALFAAGVGAWFIGATPRRYYQLPFVPTWAFVMVLPVCWTVGAAVYSHFVSRLCRCRRWVRTATGVVLMSLMMIAWPISIFLSSAAGTGGRGTVRAVEVSPDGRYEAVTESFSDGFEPSCRVWLRERGGLFSRQALAWQRIEGNCPVRVYFPDDTTISVTERKDSAPMTTTFDRDRMEVAQTLPPRGR